MRLRSRFSRIPIRATSAGMIDRYKALIDRGTGKVHRPKTGVAGS
jgi:hypothetical protein